MMVSALPLYLSAREAAALCGVDERTVRRWIASGRLRADKRGGTFRVAAADLAPFLVTESGYSGHESGHLSGHAAAPDMGAAPNTSGSTPCPPMSDVSAAAPDTEVPHLAAALE